MQAHSTLKYPVTVAGEDLEVKQTKLVPHDINRTIFLHKTILLH